MWVGCRFTPTDELLVCDFLFNKVRGLLLRVPSDFVIPELDVYDKAPWDLDIRPAYFLDDESYCFVRVCRSKEAGDERSERKARGGTWIALDKPHEIQREDGRPVAGSRRSFKFFVDIDDPTKSEEGRRVATGWMMHKYRLHPSMYPPHYKEDEEMILCRIWQGKQIRGLTLHRH
ncbi:hypothetical protein MUK42_27343 [Musa troglodytarum]|nr:hypothetical protein MUK42_27343 [Musa troglodytarum]